MSNIIQYDEDMESWQLSEDSMLDPDNPFDKLIIQARATNEMNEAFGNCSGIKMGNLPDQYKFRNAVTATTKKRYASVEEQSTRKVVIPESEPIQTRNRINKIPSNDEAASILNNEKLSSEMKQEMYRLHTTDTNLEKLIVTNISAADIVSKALLFPVKKLDFNWKQYTLRDVVISQFEDIDEFKESLRMTGVNDAKTLKLIQPIMTDKKVNSYMIVLLCFGAPANSDEAFSHVRFIEVLGATNEDNLYRYSFFRYTKEI